MALTAKRNEGRYSFHADSKHPEQFVQVKDKCLVLSHRIKKLDAEHLNQWKEKRNKLFSNPNAFQRYRWRLGIQNPEQATTEEKIKILWYFVVLNTKLPSIRETFSNLAYTALTRTPIDTNKLKSREELKNIKKVDLSVQATCGSSSVLFLQLANELLGLQGEIRSIAGHHSYIILNHESKQFFIDFSEGLIQMKYKEKSDKSWVFQNEEEYLKYIKDTFDWVILL